MCVAGESSDSDLTLHRGSDAVPPMSSHYADVSRAWDIMDIMNNMEVVFELEDRVLRSSFLPKSMGTVCGGRGQARYLAPSWIFGRSSVF
jgi:hypothetical protein